MSETLVEKGDIQGITIYRFFKNTREAVDQFLVLADESAYEHLASDHADQPMFYIIDVSRSGMFSLNYSIAKAKILVDKHTSTLRSYVAYVTDDVSDQILVDMVNALTIRKMRSTRKVFQTEQMNEAVEWLIGVRNQETAS